MSETKQAAQSDDPVMENQPEVGSSAAVRRVEAAIAALQRGEMIVVMDDESRENEGDLIMAAEKATPEAVNFMARYGRGLICAPITTARARRLGLREMVTSADRFHTAFTVSVDARHGVTTGISAGDRAKTLRLLADSAAEQAHFTIPGHVFPLTAREGGVLERPGHTEATVDFLRLAELTPAGVICEIMNDDGTMARRPELEVFAQKHHLCFCTIRDLVDFRRRHERFVEMTGSVNLPVAFTGKEFELYCFVSPFDGKEHLALVYGKIKDQENVLTRVHSECLTGDVFGSARCDCGEQLKLALQQIAEEGAGVVVYLRQEGRGIGLISKIRAYQLQDHGLDTVDANIRLGFSADQRDYSIAGHILQHLGVRSVRLLTNNPDKVHGLEASGIPVKERLPIVVSPRKENAFYLQTKKERLGHLL